MKESRDSAAKLLALHEEEQMTLQKKYELRRELYLRGRIAKADLTEAERALTDAIVRVYEDRRRLAEADRAIRTTVRDITERARYTVRTQYRPPREQPQKKRVIA